MKKFISVFFLVMLLTGVAGVAVVSAQGDAIGAQEVKNLSQDQVFEKITVAANWVFTILVIASVFVIFTAAFQFVTGGSDAAALTGARSKLIWAAVGIGLAVLARAIPTLIVNVLQS